MHTETGRRSWARRLGFLALFFAACTGTALLWGRSVGHAADQQVTGSLQRQVDGTVAINDGESVRSIVGAIDLSPFVGKEVTVLGTTGQDLVFVNQLSIDETTIVDERGVGSISTVGRIDQSASGFTSTIEGIVFSLDGDDSLNQFVDQTAHIEGQVFATAISVTSITP
jgi:hypothetical protein